MRGRSGRKERRKKLKPVVLKHPLGPYPCTPLGVGRLGQLDLFASSVWYTYHLTEDDNNTRHADIPQRVVCPI